MSDPIRIYWDGWWFSWGEPQDQAFNSTYHVCSLQQSPKDGEYFSVISSHRKATVAFKKVKPQQWVVEWQPLPDDNRGGLLSPSRMRVLVRPGEATSRPVTESSEPEIDVRAMFADDAV